MKFDGHNWRRSSTVIVLPPVEGEHHMHHLRFGRICKPGDDGAIRTSYAYVGSGEHLYAKPITPNGWSLTNMMYGKRSVRDGEVRVHAYLCKGGQCYTTSWVHRKETIELQQKEFRKRLDNS